MNHEFCKNLLEELSLYAEGEAAPELCAEIERHMAECRNCRVVIDSLRRTIDLYHRLPQPDMPERARERLYKSLDLSDYMK
ncbi:MAG: zf-HC2 domain-containing protein [Anaerolineales bacterium]|nr:zf-HC2 domain-containing protein [Anaerolineales bacterium]